jgi:hypothetical protein
MKSVIHIVLILIVVAVSGWGGYLSMGEYQNSKFGFTVRYPGHIFIKKTIPDAGDGVLLQGRDGLECRFYGSWFSESIGESYRNVLQWEQEAGSRITYKVLKKNWFVVSGLLKDGVQLFYQKTYFKKGTSVTVRFVYRIKDKNRYDNLVSEMLNGFSF